MPERNHEVIIDGFVFPDTVTVTLANDEYIDSRDYVDKELYESICAANDAWQGQNAKLRELAEKAWRIAERLCQAFDGPCRDDGTTIYKPCPLGERDEECVYGQLQRDLRELGVEVEL